MDYLVDPDLPQTPRGLPGLSIADQQALNHRENPANTLQEYQQKLAVEQTQIDNIELQRILNENANMRQQVGQLGSDLTATRSQYDNLSGQVSAMQNQQLLAAQAQQAHDQYALTQEELDNHGDLLPLVQKVTSSALHQKDQEWEQKLAAEKLRWQQEATQPLQQELQQTKEQLQIQAQRSSAEFAANMQREIESLGLGSINHVVAMPEFQQRFNQPVAPGVAVAWGDQLKKNIEDQNLYAAQAMLKDFRDSNTNLRPRVDQEVMGSSTPARPLTSAQSENLQKREQLTNLMQSRQQDANQGILPHGWDRAKYRVEQDKLKAQIDLIPTT